MQSRRIAVPSMSSLYRPPLSSPTLGCTEIFLVLVTAEGVSNTPTLQLFFKVIHKKGWPCFLPANAEAPVMTRSGSLSRGILVTTLSRTERTELQETHHEFWPPWASPLLGNLNPQGPALLLLLLHHHRPTAGWILNTRKHEWQAPWLK